MRNLRLLTIALLPLGLFAVDRFRVGQRVSLEIPQGETSWGLTDTCLNAYMVAPHKSKPDWTGTYRAKRTRVVKDVDDDQWCVFVELEDGDGWIYKDFAKVIPGAASSAAQERALRGYGLGKGYWLTGFGGSATAMIASDAACYSDLLKAVPLQGTAFRKRLVEMAEYGCLFIVPSGTAIDAKLLGDGTYAVTILEGLWKGRKGIAAPGEVANGSGL